MVCARGDFLHAPPTSRAEATVAASHLAPRWPTAAIDCFDKRANKRVALVKPIAASGPRATHAELPSAATRGGPPNNPARAGCGAWLGPKCASVQTRNKRKTTLPGDEDAYCQARRRGKPGRICPRKQCGFVRYRERLRLRTAAAGDDELFYDACGRHILAQGGRAGGERR